VSFALTGIVATLLLVAWSVSRRRRLARTRHTTSGGQPRPGLARLGLNPLGWRLVSCNAIALAAGIVCFSSSRRGLTIDWSTAWLAVLLLAALLIVWLNFYFVPGPPQEWFVAELLLLTFLMLLLTNVLVPMQYGALAIGTPYADSWLAAADASIGVHVPTLAAWTGAHPRVSQLATFTYFTFAPQLFLAVVALGTLRDRQRLWEFAFHFHFCVTATIAALAVWPAVCPARYYGFTQTIEGTRVLAQISGFHDGTMTRIRFDELEGLVSFPSFHVAGAMLVTWAFRHRRRVLIPLLLLNIGLVISTVITGVHYAVDVLAAVPLVGGSLAAYRWWGQRLLTVAEAAPQAIAA
jgi:membrane-associated phospholipid phosphatase